MNQLTTLNPLNDEGHTSRRYGGYPLNSTLISYFTPDTIRSIISHAATGKPYTTAVWIRISRIGVQISAKDPQIARTRIPVFIPLALIHDIFMQPTIKNVICIVYDEVKSNMKGVLLYVVHPADALLLRDDFRQMKSSFSSKGVVITGLDNGGLISPTSQKVVDMYRNGRSNRYTSPKRITYNRDVTPSSAPPALPQLSYTPMKSSYHSQRDDSAHRRHRSPKKSKVDQSSSKTHHDDEVERVEKPQPVSSPVTESTANQKSTPEVSDESLQTEPQVTPQQQQQIAVWQSVQKAPVIPMGLYNRYIPKAIPLPSGETIKTTLPETPMNGHAIVHIEAQPNVVTDNNNTNTNTGSRRSPSRSRSISSRRNEPPVNRHRSSSAQNPEASANLVQSSHYHHHHRHHHHHQSGSKHGSSRTDAQKYGTISHPTRKRSNHLPIITKNSSPSMDRDDEMKKYLKQLIDDMQAIKMEMNQIRQISHPSSTHGRPDTVRINLKELRHDINSIRARIAMVPKIA